MTELEQLKQENEALKKQIADLLMYKPAQRTKQTIEPVRQIRPPNYSFYGIDPSSE